MIDPNTLSSLVGMKVGDAKDVFIRMFAEDKSIPTYLPDYNVDVTSAYFNENEKNKLIVTATIKRNETHTN